MRSLHDQVRESAPLLSAGVASADPQRLGVDLARLARAGVRIAHVDVMDNTFGAPMASTATPIGAIERPWLRDVHVMVENPLPLLDELVEAGADSVTLQLESRDSISALRCLDRVSRGIAICPGTPVDALGPACGEIDLVLVLAIDPRSPGPVDVDGTARRLEAVRSLVGDRVIVGVDGRVDPVSATVYARAGAQLVVAGTALFADDAVRNARAFMRALGQSQAKHRATKGSRKPALAVGSDGADERAATPGQPDDGGRP